MYRQNCVSTSFFHLLFIITIPSFANDPLIADVHLHYKWSQTEVTSPADAIRILNSNRVKLAVVIGTPPELALKLKQAAPDSIVPVFGPYNGKRNWFQWQFDPQLLNDAREGLESGQYHGIGELHLIGGFSASWSKSKVLRGLLELATEYDVPIILHTEFSNAVFMRNVCGAYPKTKIVWAHSGAVLSPAQVREVLHNCPNVWPELAARDPWRYINNPIADDTGRLLPEWEQIVREYQDRFMVGSDPVWPVDQLDRWDEPDTGWQEIGRFLEFHRQWISHLPKAVQQKIRFGNALKLYSARHKQRISKTCNLCS